MAKYVFNSYNPEEVKRYGEIKQKAALEANENKDTYMAIKIPVIEDILKKALSCKK